MSNCWLFITNEKNWYICLKNKTWGTHHRHKNKLLEIEVNDTIIVYIKGFQIAGTCKITKPYFYSEERLWTDELYPHRISFEPLKIFDDFIDIRDFYYKNFTKKPTGYFRTSIKKLPNKEALLFLRAIGAPSRPITLKKIRLDEQRIDLNRLLDTMELRVEDLRKYTIDSVHDDSYRVLESTLNTDVYLELGNRDLEKFEYWIQKTYEVEDSENKTSDINDDLELPFSIPFEQVHEGMVFIVSGNDWVEITDLVKEESKKVYKRLLLREHSVKTRWDPSERRARARREPR